MVHDTIAALSVVVSGPLGLCDKMNVFKKTYLPVLIRYRKRMSTRKNMTENNKSPLLSLLVPIYNVETYLRECLESAHTQTLLDLEVICINDGSTDGSRDIIEEYLQKDHRFRVIDKENSGYGASMNQGLSVAQGKYIGILESDDYIEPNMMEVLVATAEANQAEVVKSNFYFYWSIDEERNEFFELITDDMSGRVVNPQKEQDIFYLKPSIWSAIYNRTFLEKNDIRFLETPGASYQDAGFNFKVWASATRVVFLKEAYLHYRQDNEQSSVNSPGKVYCVCDEYAEMDRFLAKYPEKRAYLDPVKAKMKYDSYMWNYERLTESLRREFLTKMQEELNEECANGNIDIETFDPWKKPDLLNILQSPELFHAQKLGTEGEGLLRKVKRYYRVGGFSLVTQAFRQKLKS